jgi:hypothetical protein
MVLLRFGRLYKFIYELPSYERPDDALIDDDEKLDAWFERWTRDKEREVARAYGKTAGAKQKGDLSRIPMFGGS